MTHPTPIHVVPDTEIDLHLGLLKIYQREINARIDALLNRDLSVDPAGIPDTCEAIVMSAGRVVAELHNATLRTPESIARDAAALKEVA